MGRILLSICAVVVALGLGGASPPQGKAGEQPGQTAQPQQAAPEPASPPKADDPERLYAACRQGEAKRDSDLCAQWYAADSAHEASIWTRRTGWFTGIGLIVGAITMGAAICAAFFAKEAADHTKDGAKASWAAEKVTRESAERQLRAYLVFEELNIANMTVGQVPQATALLKNVGLTPANDSRVILKMLSLPDPETHKVRGFFGPHLPTKAQIGPGAVTYPNDKASRALTQRDLDAYLAGEWSFLVVAYATYRDVFRRRRRTLVTGVVRKKEAITAEGKLRVVASDRASYST